jgi:uncharacterized membrane protein
VQIMPHWALTLVYFLHLCATVVWLGSLVGLSLLVIPAASRTLEVKDQVSLLDNIQSRLDSLSWFCLFLLIATGMFQLSASPNYHGLLGVENNWEKAILIKHGLVITLAVASAIMSWGVMPAIRRAKIKYQRTGDEQELAPLRKKEKFLLRLNLVLAALVLLATAAARAV